MNSAQEEEWQSFPLFQICACIAGYLYRVKVKKVRCFMTTMTISGEGYSTGKSLMYEACMLILYGVTLQCSAPTTIPRLYEMLSTGTPIFGKCCLKLSRVDSEVK